MKRLRESMRLKRINGKSIAECVAGSERVFVASSSSGISSFADTKEGSGAADNKEWSGAAAWWSGLAGAGWWGFVSTFGGLFILVAAGVYEAFVHGAVVQAWYWNDSAFVYGTGILFLFFNIAKSAVICSGWFCFHYSNSLVSMELLLWRRRLFWYDFGHILIVYWCINRLKDSRVLNGSTASGMEGLRVWSGGSERLGTLIGESQEAECLETKDLGESGCVRDCWEMSEIIKLID
jgi:hypothetical protein